MQITFDIPEALAAALLAAGQDPARAALEAIAIERYCIARLKGQLGQSRGNRGTRYWGEPLK